MKKLLLPRRLLGQRGQTSIEYILMFTVVVVMVISLLTYIRDTVLADSGNCTPSSQSLACSFQRILPQGDYSGFKYFTIL